MPTNVVIRQAVIDDAPDIVTFNLSLAKETEGKLLDAGVVGRGVDRALRDPSRCQYYLAEIAGRVTGQTMITREWSDWRDGWFWWIQSVYVHAEFRRCGVFRTLHTHIRREARRAPDVCGLRLYVHHDNERAIETYQRLGMIVTQYHLCEEAFGDRD